jgi:hypothetical protein
MKRWDEIAKRLEGKTGIVGAEIGVERGVTAAHLLRLSCISTYYCIDDWRFDPVYARVANHKDTSSEYHKINFEKFLRFAVFVTEKIRIITAKSTEAVKMFDDEFFDFVFIDATHSYERVRQDIDDWYPKVTEGGFICGHDYGDPRFPGVKKAVDEGWQYITPWPVELGDDYTWFKEK